MGSIQERVGVLETKVEAIDEKIDDIKADIKDVHRVMEKNTEELKTQLKVMYDASCTQHAALADKINSIEKFKEKWIYVILGVVASLGILTGNYEKLLSLLH